MQIKKTESFIFSAHLVQRVLLYFENKHGSVYVPEKQNIRMVAFRVTVQILSRMKNCFFGLYFSPLKHKNYLDQVMPGIKTPEGLCLTQKMKSKS